jgi:tetratricopeptide (TPR) repeat protein
VSLLQRELDVEPEEDTKQLYQEILRLRPARMATPEALPSGHSPPLAIRRPPLAVGTDTPLIGRDRELARARAALAEAMSGQGQVVVVSGEAGVGKTRVVTELAAEVPAMGGRVLIGRSHESEQILPFGPWVDALATGRELVDDAWLETLPLAMRRELGRLLPEFGPRDDGSAAPPDYLKLFEGVGHLLGHVAERQATVLVLEDLHWADEMSARLLAFIGRRLKAWRLLLIVTVREETLVDVPVLQRGLAELEHEPHGATVALGPLSPRDTAALVRALARPGTDEAAMARLGEQVWRTSGGNPLVVVEALRGDAHDSLSAGLEGLSVPERVRDIISRQLDRLDERSRDLVAVASVVGREFEFELLQHAGGLGEEEAARGVEELTRRRVLYSVGEGLDFTHDRVREVAYGQLVAPRRKLLHRRVAEALATLHAESLEPHHLALGLHYAAGEVWDKAVVHLRRAGARASERSANRGAVACFERALDALAHLPDNPSTLEQAFEIRLETQDALNRLGEVRHALARAREAEALAERLNDDRRRGRVRVFSTGIHALLGELDEARATGTRGLELARALGDVDLRIRMTSYLALANYFAGEYERVIELASENLGASRADGFAPKRVPDNRSAAYDRHWIIHSLAQLGRFGEAASLQAETIALAETTQHAHTIGLAYWAVSVLHLVRGDWASARSSIEQAISVHRGGNSVLMLPFELASSAWILAQAGEAGEAMSRFGEAAQLIEQHVEQGIVGHLGSTCYPLGHTCLLLGRLDEARRFAERVVDAAPSQQGFLAYARHLLGEVATQPERFDADSGEEHYRAALALAERLGMRPLVAHCHLGLGTLSSRTAKCHEAREHLTTAAAMYHEMDMRFWLEKAEAQMKLL